MLAALLVRFGSSFKRPDEILRKENRKSVRSTGTTFDSLSNSLLSHLSDDLKSLTDRWTIGNPLGNGQCLFLSVAMLLHGCKRDDNDAALWLRARCVFELIDNIELYCQLGGVGFVRDVFIWLLKANNHHRYGYCWPEIDVLFVLTNVIQKPIYIIQQVCDVFPCSSSSYSFFKG